MEVFGEGGCQWWEEERIERARHINLRQVITTKFTCWLGISSNLGSKAIFLFCLRAWDNYNYNTGQRKQIEISQEKEPLPFETACGNEFQCFQLSGFYQTFSHRLPTLGFSGVSLTRFLSPPLVAITWSPLNLTCTSKSKIACISIVFVTEEKCQFYVCEQFHSHGPVSRRLSL